MPIELTCTQCGKHLRAPDEAGGTLTRCPGCQHLLEVPLLVTEVAARRPPPSLGDDPAVRLLLPVGRSAWAIAAGYAGLFAMLFFPAPIALVLGIVAIRDIRRHPEKHGMGRAIFALVMGVVFTAVMLFFVVAALFQAPGARW